MANIIYGTDGNDVLGDNGSPYSIDSIVGGLGNDTYIVDHYKDIVVEGPDGGNDTIVIESDYIFGKTPYTLAKNVETLDLRYYSIPMYLESIVNDPNSGYTQIACDKELANLKSHRLIVNGNASDNVIALHDPRAPIDLNNTNLTGSYIKIFAGAGNDIVIGGAGDDYFDGGAGDDMLYGDSGTNTLIGGTGDDTLVGGTGVNTLSGGAGNDLLYGGIGTSFLDGGAGNDTYFIDGTETSMKITDAKGNDTLALDSSTGTFLATGASIATFTTVENIDASLVTSGTSSLTLTGNNLANHIYGSEGSDTIYTGAGNDVIYGGDDTSVDYLYGGAGNDIYGIQDKNDIIIDTEGFNTLSLGPSFTGGVDLTAEYTNANILKLDGSLASGDLTLTGNSFNNTITSSTGNDILNGGFGADLMVGSAGDDTYFVDNLKDKVVEKIGEGSDTVYLTSAMSYTLANNVENLNLTAFSLGSYSKKLGLTVKGNTLDNTIIANDTSGAYMKILAGAGNDTIIGGASSDYIDGGIDDDSIQGGKADDVLTGGAGNDTYVFSEGDGRDLITATDKGDIIKIDNSTGITTADLLFYKDTKGNFCIDYSDNAVANDVIQIAKGKYNGSTTIQIGSSHLDINSIIQTLSSAGLTADYDASGLIDVADKASQLITLSARFNGWK